MSSLRLLGLKTKFVVVSDIFGELEFFKSKTCAEGAFKRLRTNRKEKLSIIEVVCDNE